MKDALGHGSNASAAATLAQGHPKSASVGPVWEHDAPQYHAVVSAKNGRQMGKYSSPDRDAAIKEAFDKHPKARTVMSMRGSGMDMRWHNR